MNRFSEVLCLKQSREDVLLRKVSLESDNSEIKTLWYFNGM